MKDVNGETNAETLAETLTVRPGDAAPTLSVRSWFVDGVTPEAPAPFVGGLPATSMEFLTQLPTDTLACWVRGNSGLVGFGRAVRIRARGGSRFSDLSTVWRSISGNATVDNPVRLPGSGLVGFTTIAFAEDSQAESVIDIPQFIMGRRDGRVWLTAVNVTGAPHTELKLRDAALQPPRDPQVHDGHVSGERYTRAVTQAIEIMQSGRASKIVVARDAVVETGNDIDVRALVGALNRSYPSTWTFCVAGMVGATPELLISRSGDRVESRVLAGTYRVAHDPRSELAAARTQLGGAKDTAEHRYAIDSLAQTLKPLCSELEVDPEPHLLALSNVIHLASDAHGIVKPGHTLLDVAQAVHPTAAVGGVPREAAWEHIAYVEKADRGRYAGPVGWIDGNGDGQLGIALRCGQLESRNRIRLWAGCGIMPDSDPASELAETRAKLTPMMTALGVAHLIDQV